MAWALSHQNRPWRKVGQHPGGPSMPCSILDCGENYGCGGGEHREGEMDWE